MSSIDLANQTGLIPQQFYSVSSNQAKIVQADSDGILITNTATSRSLGLGAGGFLVDGTTTIDPLNLTAVSNNIVPTSLNIVDNISITDNSVDNSISIQAGQNGSVGSFFGLDYESTTNQDFIIQSTSSGSIKYKQYGIGATTKTLTFNPEEIIMDDTSNTGQTTITNTQIAVKGTTATTTPTQSTIEPNQITQSIQNLITGGINTGTLNSGSVNFSDTITSLNTNLNINGVNLQSGASANWVDIINSVSTANTYDQVLGAGNTATEKSAIITGSMPVGIITNTASKGGVIIENDTAGADWNYTSVLQNNLLNFAGFYPPVGYNFLTNITANGITQSQSVPTTQPYLISTTGDFNLTAPNMNIGSAITIPSTGANEYSQFEYRGLNCYTPNTSAQNAFYRATQFFLGDNNNNQFIQGTKQLLTIATASDSQSTLSSNDLQLTNSLLGSAYATIKSIGQALFNTFATGFTANPIIELKNSNATAGDTTGVPSIHYYKNGRNAVANDYIASQHFYAKNYVGAKTEFCRITSQTTNTALNNDDGAIGIWCLVNGTISQVFLFNGADNENNSYRPLDINGNALKTSQNNLNIDASSSSGTGQIILTPKAGSVIILNNLPTSSAGLPAGSVWRNGNVLNIV